MPQNDLLHRVTHPLFLRAAFLFGNFFLIITAYYQIKPASRSLFIEHLGASNLPYVWIGTAVILGLLMAFYQHTVARFSRERVVIGTCLLVAGLLVLFRLLWLWPNEWLSVAFYIFTDIVGVVLVEQFWSLANALYTTLDGRRWYGLVGTGGLVGGVFGGALAAALLHFTPLQTPDLLLVGAAFTGLIAIMTHSMVRLGLYRESQHAKAGEFRNGTGWGGWGHNRYLLLIAGMLLLAQLAEPVVEYQFLSIVEQAYPQREPRTEYLSLFFSVLGLVSIGVNLVLTPLVHRFLGVIAGLVIQPLALAVSTVVFMASPTLLIAAIMKISDRGLSYSINRASKELLYVPIDPLLIYQAKAWIDMFGYRIFKVMGSVLILLLTQWTAWQVSVSELGWLTLVICATWIGVIVALRSDYQILPDVLGSQPGRAR
jgi:AAA family ATP:ADP antiporter